MTADKLFLTLLNMSLTASVVIAVVVLARFALKRAPKWISYALWAVALFNLLCPFKPESVLSLNPFKPAPIPLDIGVQAIPRIDSGVSVFNDAVSAVLPAAAPTASANPLQIWTIMGAYVWLAGLVVMLIYAAVTYVLLKQKLRFATKKEDNVYETDRIRSPFVLGFVRPKIYLPAGLADADLSYILCHERTHIKRRDYLVKPVAFLALAIHWFNPLVWLAYFLLNADMEMSCDERVIKELGGEVKTVYSNALLALSTGKRLVGLSPLAFGEGGVKERVKNVLNFKKRSRVIIVAAVVLLAMLTVGFAVNKANSNDNSFVFANFKVNGFGLGQDIANIQTTTLTPVEPLNIKDGYDYNFKEARYSADEATGLLRKMQVDVFDGAEISSITMNNGNAIMNPNGALHDIEQVKTLLGNGASGWQDREQGLRYVEYWQRDGGFTATVRFVYSDKESDGINHRLIWVIAESNFQKIFDLSPDWLGNPDGEVMTLDELKQTANLYITMGRYLTLDDLAIYRGFNVSSDSRRPLMLYPVTNGFSLSASADETGAISRLSLRRASDEAVLVITGDTLEYIDNFIGGEYTPEIIPSLWDVATPHNVQWNEGGSQYAWQHSDNPGLAAVSSVRYLPAAHFDDKASLDAYAADGNRYFNFKSIFEQYGNSFFADNSLTLIYVEDGHGGVYYDIGNVSVNEGGTLQIGVTQDDSRQRGEAASDVMVARFIVIEHSRAATQSAKSYTAFIEPSVLSEPVSVEEARNPENRVSLTLEDVKAIAQKTGTNLTQDDLWYAFIGYGLSSYSGPEHVYAMDYPIDDYFLLRVNGRLGEPVETAELICLQFGEVVDTIDIRFGNVDDFITRHSLTELQRED
jgi:beta-lactamase regulating signal transducer with metallopeptidase domain